ncbi:anti-sigma regulatory factor (Ser/Thr protein kinase) [Lipingzhangella halophila]|uniref:Anti-sigma regulatory factor (Ser/Thr protein kinase) n=1 Tax=Lipingzhangella halophila TaxID=1783352 RepID=A0A7W7RCR4_9ACTN|nr:anti-sigma factor RsbA family regulatory protein [Lipingzhangella halophila]MBB4929465.1 anti-sigma regulatory factor (Ser/Thr protein kinase) [Lipingzhangella halophila]
MTSCAKPDDTGSEGFEHYGVFFDSPHELRELVVPRVRAALTDGGHVTVAVRPLHEETIRSALGGQSAELDFTSRADLYDAPGRTLAALHRLALAHPTRRVTVVAEPVLPTDAPVGLREWHRLDSVLDSALAGSRMSLLCLHDSRHLPARARGIARSTHPLLVAPNGVRTSPDYLDPATFSAPDVARTLPAPTGTVRTLDVHPDLPVLRDEVTALADTTGIPEERAGDLVLAVNELAANVLEHGAGKGTISLWRSAGWIVCDVFDERGSLTDPLSGYRPTDPRDTRGYGLWISRQMCDFMEISGGNHGSLIRMHFRPD